MSAGKVQILPLRRATPPDRACSQNARSATPSDSGGNGECLRANSTKARASKPKVRTGCITCKIRRIKCDETQPACSRCTSTGRRCDGYRILPRKQRSDRSKAVVSAPPTPERRLDVVPGTADELRAQEFFFATSSPQLASYFDASFWTQLVLQMSHSEPAIRHGLVAVSCFHQQRELSMKRSIIVEDFLATSVPMFKQTTNHNDPFALQQYNKAIFHLSKRLQDQDAVVEVSLVACILFVCIEFLRGDTQPAMSHFKSGMNIALGALSSDNPKQPKSTVVHIKEAMLPFFNRLELLSMLFGNDSAWKYSIALATAVPPHFVSLKEARDSLVHLMNLSLRFVRSMRLTKYEPRLITADDWEEKETLDRAGISWQSAFDDFLATHDINEHHEKACKVLRIHRIVLQIWLSTCTFAEECTTDAYMAKFAQAVKLGEEIRSDAGTWEQRRPYSSTFLFDMEIVSPTYFVAIKCRHPQLRRRAVRTLRQTIRREGLWDSNMAAAIAERIMTVEEGNLRALDGSQLPAEEDRVHNTNVDSPIGTGVSPAEHSITMYIKPSGPYGPFDIRKENIYVEMSS